jgi:serine/threonine protein phosphatase 1
MVLNLLRRAKARKPDPPVRAFVPEGERVYAIGDIHGRLDLLDALLEMIAEDSAGSSAAIQLVFLGDMIDRGPQSAQVVEQILGLRESGRAVRALLGNHEEMLLRALGSPRAEAMNLFLRNGGHETLLSYGISETEILEESADTLRELALSHIPKAHLAFLASLEDWIEVGDYLFVHAGIRPGLPLEHQMPADLRWIRKEFLESGADHGRVVVHGHTIRPEPDVRFNRIGIDTGAYRTGVLTAFAAEGEHRWLLATSAEPVA